MKLFHGIVFILLFIHISSYCFYEGKASQSFCSKREVDFSEATDPDQYSGYACCYVWVVIDGKKTEGCFATHPTQVKDVVGCTSSNTNNNGNKDGNKDDDDGQIPIFNSYNEYLLLKIYKIIIFTLLILY